MCMFIHINILGSDYILTVCLVPLFDWSVGAIGPWASSKTSREYSNTHHKEMCSDTETGSCFSGLRLNINTVFPCMGIPLLKIRRSRNRLIFNMEIPIQVRWHIYVDTAPEALLSFVHEWIDIYAMSTIDTAQSLMEYLECMPLEITNGFNRSTQLYSPCNLSIPQ